MIYLDHNATTPVLPEVFEAMRPYLCDEWGNPSSTYRFGAKLKTAVENARGQVAELIGALQREVLFTSCGTESNNTAIHSAILSRPEKRHILTSRVEHSSVLSYCRFLEKHHGYRVTYLPVDRDGLLSLADGEDGYSIEVFNALGHTIAVDSVPESALQPLLENEVFSARNNQAAKKNSGGSECVCFSAQNIPFASPTRFRQ